MWNVLHAHLVAPEHTAQEGGATCTAAAAAAAAAAGVAAACVASQGANVHEEL